MLDMHPFPPGSLFDGRYQIEQYISRGGMSHIYQAWDMVTKRRVVLKIARQDNEYTQAFIERLRYEAQVLSTLSHPNVVSFIDFQEHAPWTYLVLQWIPGKNLRDHFRERGTPFTVHEITPWVRDICDALGYLHGKGIVHCDLKPTNILISADRAFLIDFSVAQVRGKLLPFREIPLPAGTVAYMSPEQLQGKVLDARADIYSLGTVIFELLTLVRPFVDVERHSRLGHLWDEMSRVKSQRDPPLLRDLAPEISTAVAEVVSHAIARRPEERWTSARDFWRAWMAASRGEPFPETTPAAHSATPSQLPKLTRRTILIIIGLGAIGALTGLLFARSRPHHIVVNRCQTVLLSFPTEQGQDIDVKWTTCVNSLTVSSRVMRVNVSWSCQIAHANASIERPPDQPNSNTIYLLDDTGRRFPISNVGGAATQTVQFQPGDQYSGWYEFPLPSPSPSRIAFVDDDIGVKIWLDMP